MYLGKILHSQDKCVILITANLFGKNVRRFDYDISELSLVILHLFASAQVSILKYTSEQCPLIHNVFSVLFHSLP